MCRSAPRSHSSTRSWSLAGSVSQVHGAVSLRASATEADSTMGWPWMLWWPITGQDSKSPRPGVRVPRASPAV